MHLNIIKFISTFHLLFLYIAKNILYCHYVDIYKIANGILMENVRPFTQIW